MGITENMLKRAEDGRKGGGGEGGKEYCEY